jgi:hypothetical protein
MFEWVFLLLTPRVAADAPVPAEDYVGVVAAEVAYATLDIGGAVPGPSPAPAPPVDPKNCSTCKNSGRPGWVRTGDGQGWSRCPTCQPVESASLPSTDTTGWPPKPRNDCPTGTCPPPVAAGQKTAGSFPQAR